HAALAEMEMGWGRCLCRCLRGLQGHTITSPYVSSSRPEEPRPMESEIRARSNSLGGPRLPRLTSPRAWWHQTSPTSPDDGGDFHTTRVGSERAHGLLRQPRHGSRAWYCPFTLASGSDPRHESRVAHLGRHVVGTGRVDPRVHAIVPEHRLHVVPRLTEAH